ncbi:M23 family metallopeptidase [Sinanaerobacter sp. ZZT-01]|uniref:M23 family metallopeptidase n=1 Tax=Sinanaerobacter sp. ZZT-01 TaxID=3111540 RepID=UPI002D776007|nr:M23 family metallopeptidase [Sinanaerobacter sp. ZZT-01]WRR93398.1 M23 family metallopeptidase [Sinanaerobacter sp. ZZT-01]
MRLDNIKTPEALKLKTIVLMNQELKYKPRKILKVAIIAVCIPVLFAFTAFACDIFSGLSGDELSFSTEYQGDGIVEVTVKNRSEKALQFTDIIKLKQWSTSQEILEIKQTLPRIKPGKTEGITIDLSDYDMAVLETPLADNDWYYFVFTNSNFRHGHDWMASVIFWEAKRTEPSNEDSNITSEIPIEDHTSQKTIESIKNNYTLQEPLNKFSISCPYNDYKENGAYVHPELDLEAESGSDIYAICEGTVLEADFNEKTGFYMIIDHGNGLKSKYACCKESFKKQGDTVALGDVIASVGKTGMATGSHLAFSVSMDGIPINPELLFK